MNHIEELVAEFNEQITKYQPPNTPTMITGALVELRVMQMQEELDEILVALVSNDLVETIDGLMDLIYFAIGTLHLVGVHREKFNTIFQIIHEANMRKVSGIKPTRFIPGVPEHLHPTDAIKPEGWEAPNEIIRSLLDDSSN